MVPVVKFIFQDFPDDLSIKEINGAIWVKGYFETERGIDPGQGNCRPVTPRNYIWHQPDLHQVLTEKELLRFSAKSWQMASLLNVDQKLRELIQVEEKMGKAEKRITVAAILPGAATGLLVGVLNLSNSNANLSEEIGIAGGVAEATLGFLSLKITRNRQFAHHGNHLHDIWYNADSTANFPPTIWYYLDLPFTTGQPSLRESLKQQ